MHGLYELTITNLGNEIFREQIKEPTVSKELAKLIREVIRDNELRISPKAKGRSQGESPI